MDIDEQAPMPTEDVFHLIQIGTFSGTGRYKNMLIQQLQNNWINYSTI